MKKLFKTSRNIEKASKSALELLMLETPFEMDGDERAMMTVGCRDTDYIPKVQNAGDTTTFEGTEVQLMHNGIKVIHGGYFGEWMATIISSLKGHHEPQEEKIFYEVLKRIDKPGAMIELGAFWTYYSLWYKHSFPRAKVVACEPDPINLAIGQKNAEINGLDIIFVQSAAGKKDHQEISFRPDSSSYEGLVETEIRTVDGLCKDLGLRSLSVLHMDVQGVEMSALQGAEEMIKSGNVRFLFVSTHHYSISGELSTHLRCLDWIKQHEGHIVSEHSVVESFSGDGLIVASFTKQDKDFVVHTSINSSNKSLFRSYEKDLVYLADKYDGLLKSGAFYE